MNVCVDVTLTTKIIDCQTAAGFQMIAIQARLTAISIFMNQIIDLTVEATRSSRVSTGPIAPSKGTR
jgi:hypothetical protein